MATTTSQSGVKSAMRTLDLIEYVVARPAGAVAQEIAASLSIPISSLSYLLATLVEREYLRRDGRRYYAGTGLDRLHRSPADVSLIDHARPLVKALKQHINETTSLFVQVEWDVEAVLTETSGHNLRYAIDVGSRTPMHCVSAGKVLLAHLPAAELDRYFEESVRLPFTEFTICDRAGIERELATIRETGIAFTRDEYTVGITGIGVAIKVDGEAVAALSVGAPTPRFSDAAKARICEHLQLSASALEAARLA